MENSLLYLRETLSNYLERSHRSHAIYKKILKGNFSTVSSFVESLNQEEVDLLNEILPEELNYARNEKDQKRYQELFEVYEQLY
ncbi:sigma-G-dependent sporulation-specific acid-soluble spore protein CsgA [Bacillus sp. FJAT-47783]|uniref:sigma-G-dependent sporulation-specific acid-soluble spore protein CsgA n=1 Tax=Bacillus sp. FJAT-47783 TaxID=2922712 RepID=UPI001FAE270A|nr:sigma-G-dependent sporulation-specific acid-soluble spore protein CsgA [Bacillus sp. FJAT-47783]